ncbi:hypothetical protein [Dactylosporangium matsuzakiense]|uniref:Uncharacterized protein n=1 Tax=Dactylosporangium matsuzakiense TaxID=53360 RepID=A0A9W6KV59_9ACTN|nr:hypothetical protein [Dactylosporangium matsuzakiense]UWZ42292.1 hypothetical protein Dmats_32610 [Dactylosporangium matsuzakiense]GLL07279.1 hypothetical protein GCM10017581_090310 [Dactylosporangium matsuzakiense]
MYAVELCFTVDAGSVPPSIETMEASIRRNDRRETTKIEHLRVRKGPGTMYVVVFITAEAATETRGFAEEVGPAVADELRHVSYSGFRIWTGDEFGTEGMRS